LKSDQNGIESRAVEERRGRARVLLKSDQNGIERQWRLLHRWQAWQEEKDFL